MTSKEELGMEMYGAQEINSQKLSYVSLFSGAGIGCYGFSQEKYECVVTNELLEKRLRIQKLNNKCNSEDGYVQGDISHPSVKEEINKRIENWLQSHNSESIDVVIPPPSTEIIEAYQEKFSEFLDETWRERKAKLDAWDKGRRGRPRKTPDEKGEK